MYYLVFNNKYLDLYCKVILNNINTKKEYGKTERHHATPRVIFKLLGHPNSDTRTPNDIVNKNNIVHLTYRDHLLVHYYLANCAKSDYKGLAAWTFIRMIGVKTDNQKRPSINKITEIDFKNYEKLRLLANRTQVNQLHCNGSRVFKDDLKRISKKEFVDYFIKQDHTAAETSKHFNIPKMSVSRIATVYKVKKNLGDEIINNEVLAKKIKKFYIDDAHDYDETLTHFHLYTEQFTKICHKYNIKKVPGQRRQSRFTNNLKAENILSKDLLYNLIYEQHKSVENISNTYKISTYIVSRIIKSFNFDMPGALYKNNIKQLMLNIKFEDLNKYYIIENHTLENTCAHFKLKEKHILKLLNKYKLKKKI